MFHEFRFLFPLPFIDQFFHPVGGRVCDKEGVGGVMLAHYKLNLIENMIIWCNIQIVNLVRQTMTI